MPLLVVGGGTRCTVLAPQESPSCRGRYTVVRGR